MTESAQLFHGVHDTPVYTDVLFNKPLRLPVVIPLASGIPLTAVATLRLLDSGHARTALIVGLSLTAAVAGIGARSSRPAAPASASGCTRCGAPSIPKPSAPSMLRCSPHPRKSSATYGSLRTASTPTTC